MAAWNSLVGLRPVLALADAAVYVLPRARISAISSAVARRQASRAAEGSKISRSSKRSPPPLDLVQVGKAVVVDLGGGGG